MQALKEKNVKEIKYPELIPVAEKLGWTYEALILHIINN